MKMMEYFPNCGKVGVIFFVLYKRFKLKLLQEKEHSLFNMNKYKFFPEFWFRFKGISQSLGCKKVTSKNSGNIH